MTDMAFIVRSGDGYLVDDRTLEMVSGGQRDQGALEAQRYELRGVAEHAADMLRDRGFDAELVRLEIGRMVA